MLIELIITMSKIYEADMRPVINYLCKLLTTKTIERKLMACLIKLINDHRLIRQSVFNKLQRGLSDKRKLLLSLQILKELSKEFPDALIIEYGETLLHIREYCFRPGHGLALVSKFLRLITRIVQSTA